MPKGGTLTNFILRNAHSKRNDQRAINKNFNKSEIELQFMPNSCHKRFLTWKAALGAKSKEFDEGHATMDDFFSSLFWDSGETDMQPTTTTTSTKMNKKLNFKNQLNEKKRR